MVPSRWMTYMDRTVRFQETLRRLAMIDDGLVEDQAGLGLDPAGPSPLDPKRWPRCRVPAPLTSCPRSTSSGWNARPACGR
jgi:hypothetical protein